MTHVPYFVARPESEAPWPGVVVVMEGIGISPQLLRVCQRLAAEGFAALAPDLFHRTGGSDPDRWADQFRAMTDEQALEDLRNAVAEARRLGARTVGMVGFCMGGRLAYLASVSGVEVDAAVPFYGAGIGRLLGEPSCPVLLFYGGTDRYIPPEEIEQVRRHHGKRLIVYPEAGHGFMRDGSEGYREDDARDAWGRAVDFLRGALS